MDWEELDPKKPQQQRNLEVMGIAEIKEYIRELQTEITRALEMLSRKEKIQESAQNFFRKREN